MQVLEGFSTQLECLQVATELKKKMEIIVRIMAMVGSTWPNEDPETVGDSVSKREWLQRKDNHERNKPDKDVKPKQPYVEPYRFRP